jgi:dethiobiotin synthetase
VAALDRTYWKPIQTGAVEGTDRQTVMKWAGVSEEQTCPESYIFDPPVSPHLAAEWEKTVIDLETIQRPSITDPLIIEGAGGILVPVNREAFMVDVIRRLESDVVVAARTALGTINHTLLTLAAIRAAGLKLRGVVMIGLANADNRRAVEQYGGVPVIGWIPWLETIDRRTLRSTFEQYFDKQACA